MEKFLWCHGWRREFAWSTHKKQATFCCFGPKRSLQIICHGIQKVRKWRLMVKILRENMRGVLFFRCFQSTNFKYTPKKKFSISPRERTHKITYYDNFSWFCSSLTKMWLSRATRCFLRVFQCNTGFLYVELINQCALCTPQDACTMTKEDLLGDVGLRDEGKCVSCRHVIGKHISKPPGPNKYEIFNEYSKGRKQCNMKHHHHHTQKINFSINF